MSRRAPSAAARKSGRRKTLLWITAMAAIIIGLLYWEKIALLYVLATLGVTALLVIVALADLGGAKRELTEPAAAAPADDAAALGTGIASSIPAGASPSSASRAASKRR